MKSKFALFLLVLASGCGMQPAFAQTAAPPAISDAQKAAYFKAQVQARQAEIQSQTAQAFLQAAGKAIIDTCGKDFVPILDAKGDPVCVAPAKK